MSSKGSAEKLAVASKSPVRVPKMPTPTPADLKPVKVKTKKAAKKAKKPVIKTIKKSRKAPKESLLEKLNPTGRGRPRVRPFDAAVHRPDVKPTYWRSAGSVEENLPDHALSADEVRERLRSIGYRALPGSRAGVLFALTSKGATFEEIAAAWVAKTYKTTFLKHMLKCCVKAGALSRREDGTYVFGGH
jgi:hypothetical protein